MYVDHTARIGGGEVALANLVAHLDRGVVDPVVVLFEDGPLYKRIAANAETVILPLSPSVGQTSKDKLGLGKLFDLKTVWLTMMQIYRLARLTRKMRIDLIHTNSLKADIIGGLAGRLAGVPVIWHVRDRIEDDYLPPRVVRMFRLLSRLIPKYVIANSVPTLATLKLPAWKRSSAIGSGVDLTELSPLPEQMVEASGDEGVSAARGPRIGLVGRISPWKGQHIFLKAAAEVLQQHPEARFEIIGAALFAEQDYEASLHDLCRELQIEYAINFVGFVNDVQAYVAGLTFLVHASTTGEPFGQVIVEAMGVGKPVVATRGGGVVDIVVDGETGILVPMGEVHPMAEAIQFLLDHPHAGSEMGARGRERVLANFTIQRTAKMVQKVYEEVLSA